MKTNYLSDLNPAQKKAVESTAGPILIVAGPGSGKTRVITSRIAHMILHRDIHPRKIAAVTFTNKAANEMTGRLNSILSKVALDITAKTFHSFCALILRIDGKHIGIPSDFSIFDDDDQISAIKKAMEEVQVDPKKVAARGILSSISNAKSQLISVEGLALNKSSYYDEIVERVFRSYESILRKSNALDFDDLLAKTHFLFDHHSEVLTKYQNRFEYLMVDEFQDTNIAQYNIARQLANKHRNLCVVGDPDQSIYSWRNADIKNIFSFQKDFPESKIISLEENYRSTQTILDAAKHLISSNHQRVEKDLWTRNSQGNLIQTMKGYNDEEEATLVIKEVGHLLSSNETVPRDIAVMYRVNALSRALEIACQRYGIQYQIVGGVKFYQRKEVKDLTAYLRSILNPHDDISLSRVINTPPRGIGQRTIEEITRISKEHDKSLFSIISQISNQNSFSDSFNAQLGPRAINALAQFKNIIQTLTAELEHESLPVLIDSVISISGLGSSLENKEYGEEKLENLQEYKNSSRNYQHLKGRDGLVAFMESVALVSDIDSMEDDKDTVALITLHQAKGLEFPVVFIVGMEEGILPHIKSIENGDPLELEEERRLFYVGMTRAKEKLYLSRASLRGFYGSSEPTLPSRFIGDIPAELIEDMSHKSAELMKLRSLRDKNVNNQLGVPMRNATTPNDLHSKQRITKRPYQQPISKDIDEKTQSTPTEPQNDQASNYEVGDKIVHSVYGEGLVVKQKILKDDIQITVIFKKTSGMKDLLVSLAPLNKIT